MSKELAIRKRYSRGNCVVRESTTSCADRKSPSRCEAVKTQIPARPPCRGVYPDEGDFCTGVRDVLHPEGVQEWFTTLVRHGENVFHVRKAGGLVYLWLQVSNPTDSPPLVMVYRTHGGTCHTWSST